MDRIEVDGIAPHANDDMMLDAAINGHADAIVTFNRRDYGDVPNEFGIAVLAPREALKRIMT